MNCFVGFFSYLFLGGLSLYGIHKIKESNEITRQEEERKIQKEKKRKSCVYCFDEGLSKEEFNKIVFSCTKKIKRIENVEIDGLALYATVSSVSGISSWDFTLDFNDYGKLTGKCYSKSENYDSDIPQKLNNLIYEKLEPYIDSINQKRKNEEELIEQEKARKAQEESNCAKRKRRAKQRRRKKFCKKHWKGIVVFVCIILLSILTAIGYYQYIKLIPTGYNDEELVGLSYEAVEEKLENAGFTNISTIATEDLTLEQIELESIVFEIKISDDTDFEKDKKYPYDTEIIVRYHAIAPVSSPVSSKEIKKQNYHEVQTQFKEAGFVNISLEPIYDLALGWFVSDGEIESITVNGEDEFYKGEEFRPDDAVVIKYHTLKKNKPKK